VPNRTPLIRVTAMPADTNPYGGVFGGWLMGQMGLACGSFASRCTRGKAIMVAEREFTFVALDEAGKPREIAHD
jgi:acyl-CoA thioesterase YciA